MFTFINKEQMPSYLNESQFEQWEMYFNQLIRKIGLSALGFDDLNIEFSDVVETSRYGALSIQELKELIREIWGENEEIESILEKIEDYNDYKKLIQELMEIIRRIRNSNPEVENPEILYGLLRELEFECLVEGRYIHNEKKIVLFTKAIECVATNHGNTLEQEFEQVFIHELFHAYHYKNDAGEIVKRKDYTSKVVKESLASAFEWFYCVENKINGHNELRNSWSNHSVLVYPYSGALDLLKITGMFTMSYSLNTKKFYDVFDKSLSDMDGSLRDLLELDTFYRIKNTSFHFEKTRTKVRTTVVKRATSATPSAPRVRVRRGENEKLVKSVIENVIASGKMTSSLVDELQQPSYTKNNFGIPKFPFLLKESEFSYHSYDRSRFYRGTLEINGENYLVCSQWYPDKIKRLLDWATKL